VKKTAGHARPRECRGSYQDVHEESVDKEEEYPV